MRISTKKRFIVFAFFLAIAFGAGFFLIRSIKDSTNSDLSSKMASLQKEGSGYITKTNSEDGIDVRLENQDDFGISLPKTLANPIRIVIPEYPAVEIMDQDETNRSARMIEGNKIMQNDQNAKVVAAIKQDSNLAVYQTPDKRKSILYAYEGNPSEKGKGQFKNWILYEKGSGQEMESFKIAKGKIVVNQNGDAKIYAEGRTDIINQNPDFTIPRPYFIDRDGQKTDLDWEFDAEKNTLAVKLTAKQNQYPLALDPTIMYDATLLRAVGTVKTIGSVKVKTEIPWKCGDTVTGKSPDTLTYGTVVGADGKCWLDRNLGATQVATSSTDAAAYGWLYQWGRLTDGHQIGTSSITATLSTNDVPGHSNFIKTDFNSPYDWRNPQNDNLWQGVSGINNPCPTGFRLPTLTEWSTLFAATPAITNSATAFSSTLKLPLAGLRQYYNDTPLHDQGFSGRCWSSSVSGTNASYVFFLSSNAGSQTNFRAVGNSVRCVKDSYTPPPALFNFTDQTGVNPSTLTNSDIKQITGLSAAAAVSISGDGSPEYRICGDSACSSVDHTWSSSAGSIDNNQYLQLRLTSNAAVCPTINSATVMVGDGSNKWSVTTAWSCGCTIQGLSPDTLTYGTVTGADTKCWLDRNLGATQVATSSTDSASYGWLYQWGRLTDGHQISTSGTTTTLATSDIPGHANFITTSSSPYDWRSDNNRNRWATGANNPCPTGFHVPTSAEWTTLKAAAPAITNSATALSSTLKLPLVGYRGYNGSLYSQGSLGRYWSSSVGGVFASSLNFDSSSSSMGATSYLAYGFSVRCVKN